LYQVKFFVAIPSKVNQHGSMFVVNIGKVRAKALCPFGLCEEARNGD
jgi:hypothetical protein